MNGKTQTIDMVQDEREESVKVFGETAEKKEKDCPIRRMFRNNLKTSSK